MYIYICIHICIYIYAYMYVCIYIYIERERERVRKRESGREVESACVRARSPFSSLSAIYIRTHMHVYARVRTRGCQRRHTRLNVNNTAACMHTALRSLQRVGAPGIAAYRARYSHLTCFTSKKVQILTHKLLRLELRPLAPGTQFTCFTSTRVQMQRVCNTARRCIRAAFVPQQLVRQYLYFCTRKATARRR